MNSSRTIVLFFFLAVLCNQARAQASFNIEYYFRLFDEKGQVVTGVDLRKYKVCINPYPGTFEELKYDHASRYFYAMVHTTWPIFTVVVKKSGKEMEFSMNYPTSRKKMYLDSLYFKEGRFLLEGSHLDKYRVSTDSVSQHFVFPDYSPFRKPDDADEGKDRKLRCW